MRGRRANGRRGTVRVTMLAALLALCSVQCSLATTEPGGGDVRGSGRRILFLGNSLTYVNDVPGLVQGLAAGSGGEPLAVATVAFPDVSLEDLWNQGEARRVIARGDWSVVVMQQGPSAVEENRELLRRYARQFDGAIRAAGARSALYAIWPWAWRLQDYDRSTESYALAAADVDGLMFPVAEAWRAAWRRDPSLQLYAADGVHATPLGSYTAALVIYAMLADRSPVGLPTSVRTGGGGTLNVEAEQARVLQEAAAEAIAGFGRR